MERTMKMKRYIKPETRVMAVELEQMIAASPVASTSLDNSSTITDSSLFESKKHNSGTSDSLWDLDADELEDEEND